MSYYNQTSDNGYDKNKCELSPRKCTEQIKNTSSKSSFWMSRLFKS